MDARERVGKLQSLVAHLVHIRKPWAEVWGDVRQVVRPGRRWHANELRPHEICAEDLVSRHIMDNSAGRAYRILSSGLHSGLTPPSRSWFSLRIKDEDLMEYGPVKEWLHVVERILYSAFASSNFYPSMHSVYTDLATCCSGSLGMQGRSGVGMVFGDVPIGSFAWGGDAYGKIHTMARYIGISAGELVATYGSSNVSTATRETARKDPYKEVPCIHIVMPRAYTEREPGKIDRKNKPFASYLYESDGGCLVSEGGFDNFPYLAARWDVSAGELYGRGVGFDTLPDVRMLQSVAKDQSMVIGMSARPPMKIPASLKDKVFLIPGAKNYVSDAQQIDGIKPLYEVRADIGAISSKIADVRQAIEEGYFNRLFLSLLQTTKNMTAYEVASRDSEKMLMLGPVIERHQTDILDPCISSTYASLDAMGAIPAPPDEVAGMDMEISFISVLAQAQRLTQATAIRNNAKDVAILKEIDPSVVTKFDAHQALDELASIEGTPPRVIRTDDVVAAMMQQQEEQAAAAQEQERMNAMNQQMVSDMAALGNASTAPGTALGDLLQSAGMGAETGGM